MTASKGIPRRPSSATYSRTKFRCAELCRHLGAEMIVDERANLGEAIPRLGGNHSNRTVTAVIGTVTIDFGKEWCNIHSCPVLQKTLLTAFVTHSTRVYHLEGSGGWIAW